MWSSTQFYAWVASMLNVSQQAVEQWVWSGLILGFLFATVHLVTMLVTRWGDHHASSKALLFSVLIHISSGAGVFVLAPGVVREQVARDLEPIRLQEVVLAGPRQTREDAAGNTPAWEQVPPREPRPLSRLERDAFTIPPSQSPQREKEEPFIPPVDIPPTQQPLPRPQESPELARTSPPEKLNERPSLPEPDQPSIPTAPPEETLGTEPNTAATRSPLPRSIMQSERVNRPVEGGVDSLAPVIPEPRPLLRPDLERGPQPELSERAELADTIERRRAPEQATADNMLTGEQMPAGEAPSPESRQENRAITRSQRGSGSTAAPATEDIARMTPSAPESLLEPGDLVPRSLGSTEDSVPRLNDLPEMRFDAVRRAETAEIPATYRLRDLARRREIARQQGGTDASEEAVERSLAWLASAQEQDGSWNGTKWGAGRIEVDEAGINRLRAGAQADTGLTGLAVLAFLGAGYTQEEGKYSRNVSRALEWLITQQREDGYLGGEATRYAGMYCHGMAAYALAEAYGMQSERRTNDRLGQAVVQAMQFTVAMQSEKDGGWRYLPGWSGDMSMFGWQMMALKSADIAGIPMPDSARNLMLKFLVERSQGPNKGLAAYHPEYGPEVTPAMTAEALFCKQMMGIQRENPASREAVEYLLNREHRPRKSYPNLYYWYYGTLAMYQYGGPEWQEWNELLRELLIEAQVKRGPLAGSWNPDGPWGGYGGRVYSTALATLSLEVYYRFLPLYRLGEE